MIFFHIGIPADVPPEVVAFVWRTIDALRVYLNSLGHEPITAEIRGDDDEQEG